jgi:hypothetical protein
MFDQRVVHRHGLTLGSLHDDWNVVVDTGVIAPVAFGLSVLIQ